MQSAKHATPRSWFEFYILITAHISYGKCYKLLPIIAMQLQNAVKKLNIDFSWWYPINEVSYTPKWQPLLVTLQKRRWIEKYITFASHGDWMRSKTWHIHNRPNSVSWTSCIRIYWPLRRQEKYRSAKLNIIRSSCVIFFTLTAIVQCFRSLILPLVETSIEPRFCTRIG